MSYYLLDHPNPNGNHFHTTRRNRVLAIVLHVTAGLEDLDATDDHSAENTARYAATTDRTVSWHWGSDTDSFIELLPTSYTAFHVVGYNSSTVGLEISKRHADWRPMDERWVDRTLRVAAAGVAPHARALGIPLRLANKAELDHAIAASGNPVGFVYHWQLDDARRQDPGQVGSIDTFPIARFLALVGDPAGPSQPPPDAWTRSKTMDLYDAPDGTVHHVVIGEDGAVWHAVAANAKALVTASYSPLGGQVHSVSGHFDGNDEIVVGHGLDDRVWVKAYTGGAWGRWEQNPIARLKGD